MIGIFDSGVGGMTVAKAVEQLLPEKRLVYFGDLARTPYGSKSPETICKYARQITEFLLNRGAKIIVIACNSAASVASDLLAAEFPVPVFEVITPAIEKALAVTASNRIGVIGTRATIKSNIYEAKIRQARRDAVVISQPCPLLVPLVEEGWLDKRETKMILRRYLHPLKHKGVDTLVLGCTHYPLLKHLISPRIGNQVNVIDSSTAVADMVKKYLQNHPEMDKALSNGGENLYYVSDVTDAARATAQRIFGRNLDLIQVDVEGN
ncbi:MAG: glutamate racemase [Deltaproteobacteria bacterium]|nr:glutamate racemase [Deltaproteobacteria bacterium]